MTLSSNLQQLMQTHGNLSVSELARLASIPQPTLHHILIGETKTPRKKALEALANFFSINTAQLIGEEPLPNIIPDIIKENLKLRTVPIIYWDTLNSWPHNEEVKHTNFQETLVEKKVAKNSFALVLQDSLMEPLFPKNSLLIFDSGKIPADRDFIIAKLNKDGIVFNRLFKENHDNYIKQNLKDGNAKLLKLDDSTQIVGTLIEARIQF